MPDLTAAVDILVNYPQQWVGAALLVMFAVGAVKWTPPARTVAAMPCSCGGDMETCRCGTPTNPNPRPFVGGAR